MDTNEKQNVRRQLGDLLDRRIVILDGAKGTMVQRLGLSEAEIRGTRLARHAPDMSLKNFVDLLCLSRPELVTEIHRQYLEVGADIIQTNTFGASPVAMEEFGLAALAPDLNRAAARCA